MYRFLIKPFLFLFAPETAHTLVFTLLRISGKLPGMRSLFRLVLGHQHENEAVVIAGLKFPNRVGLAAGFDKDALCYREFGALGFGFVEIGTVTPVPQPGNPKPRLFRLPKDNALINRMGFNNSGMMAIARRLKKYRGTLVVGGNIGKNKFTPNEEAIQDYEKSFRTLYAFVDYFVVNVSSPNTPGLRALQEKGPLLQILNRLQEINRELSSHRTPKPVFLKIAPDLSNVQLDDVVEVILLSGCAGVIATNTTISRDKLSTSKEEVGSIGAGGLSGSPLRERSTEVIKYLHNHANGKFAIIGVGGIHSANDALEKINAGADLIQLYTGFVYEGPALVKKIRKALAAG
jgi:dihydroorotate dehydrogenase